MTSIFEEGEEDVTPQALGGVASTLKFLQSNKLQEDSEIWIGRKTDRKVDYALEEDLKKPKVQETKPDLKKSKKKEGYNFKFTLEYKDIFGRPLTAKEAFRQMSHRFHGKLPGKNKVAKRMKQLEEEMKRKALNTDSTIMTATAMQREQERTQVPYIVLSSGKGSGAEPQYDELKEVNIQKGIASEENEAFAPQEHEPSQTTEQPPQTQGGFKEGEFRQFKIGASSIRKKQKL